MRVRSRRPSTDIATAVSAVLRSLAVCAPVALAAVHGSRAWAADPVPLTADIPAQSLAHALEVYAGQTGLQLVYVSGVVRSQRSHAVSAGMSPEEALTRLLQGTGLRFEYLTSHSIRILAAPSPANTTMRSASGDSLDEVVVTANRREENLQDVPITIQVLTNLQLSRLNITTFDDLVRYLPGVTAHGVGPSQNNIYGRGRGTGDFGNQAAGSNGSFPNVAIYLDEQSAQLPGRNLDIYAADLDRVEVLQGPQGTLFGAGAQAGVLRYITNKPKLNTTEGGVEPSYSTTAHGDPSDSVQAYINIPLIEDTLAVRAVIYDDSRGGYIHNIPVTFARSGTDLGIVDYFGGSRNGNTVITPGVVPAGSETANNSALGNSAYNPTVYRARRVSGLY